MNVFAMDLSAKNSGTYNDVNALENMFERHFSLLKLCENLS